MAREAALFAVGGAIGFVIDAGIVQMLVRGAGWDPYLARIPSFLAAASVTWWWNRRFSFAHRRGDDAHREWLRWMAVMAVGAVINYGTYALVLAFSDTARAWPAMGVAAGSCVAAIANFAGARKLVFRGAKHVV
nr:GtrA family protein [Oleiagrimonas soli]